MLIATLQRLRLCPRLLVSSSRRPFSHLLNLLQTPSNLLRPPPRTPLLLLPSAGMKWVVTPKKRCKDCYFEVQDEVLYVFCPTHPRHKQGTKQPRLKHTWIMTHATNGSHGSGYGNGRREMLTQHSFRLDF